MSVNPNRVYYYNNLEYIEGAVVYWMQRDQRSHDNHALNYACEQGRLRKESVIVVFCLAPGFIGATIRQFGFMLKGLMDVERSLTNRNIPFHLLQGAPEEKIPEFLKNTCAGMLVTDFNPVRVVAEWKKCVSGRVNVPFIEVDAHNVIPCRFISPKQEYAAFTLRKKVEKLLPEYLSDIHDPTFEQSSGSVLPLEKIDWKSLLTGLKVDRTVGEVDWLIPGEGAALAAMNDFIAHRLDAYVTERNFPDRKGQSDLSPYLHFGHLSAQRLAIEVSRAVVNADSKMAFLEELIVRRELADNFCLYTCDYDRVAAFQPWARQTLNKHREDPREYLYTPDQFENCLTHDPLWNAAQSEMVKTGKMHGFMRMYWAKKILEWSPSPEDAMSTAIYLNDKYELDGRDPNGYAGIAWSMGGTHDRPWGERPVFGMIRFMNYQGCKRKFDIRRYIKNINAI